MKHTMIDCYDAGNDMADNMLYINNTLNTLAYRLNLPAVSPPVIIPYFYGKVAEDAGISAFLMLKGGHVTIHCFPQRECYFLDVLSTGFYSTEKLYDELDRLLPFGKSVSSKSSYDRRLNASDLEIDADGDFGPHAIARIKSTNITVDMVLDFLENLPKKISMDAITRPFVFKAADYISGIILIAESHIALHYDKESQTMYFDIFSCTIFDYSKIEGLIAESFGKVENCIVVPRGSKHAHKKNSSQGRAAALGAVQWKNNI